MRVNIKHLILIAAVGAAAACQDYERSVAAPSGDYASQQGQKAPEANRPIVRITSPISGDVVAGGEGAVGGALSPAAPRSPSSSRR